MPAAKKAQAVAAKKTAAKKVVKPKVSAGAVSPALAAATAAALEVNLADSTPETVDTTAQTVQQGTTAQTAQQGNPAAFFEELTKHLRAQVARRPNDSDDDDEVPTHPGLRLLRVAELSSADLRSLPRDVRALFLERAVVRTAVQSQQMFHFGSEGLRDFVRAPQVVYSAGTAEEIARFTCIASMRLFRRGLSELGLLARDYPARTAFALDDLTLEVLVELYAIWKSMDSRSAGSVFRGFSATVALHTLDRESLARFGSAAELIGRDESSMVSLATVARQAALVVAPPEPRRVAGAPFSPPRRCSFCGFAGHTVEVCRKRLAPLPLAPTAPKLEKTAA